MKTRYKILILSCIVLLAISIPLIFLEIPRTYTITGTMTDFIYNGYCIIKIDSTIYYLDADGSVYVQNKEISASGMTYYQNAWVPVIGTAELSGFIGYRCQLTYETTFLNQNGTASSPAHFVSLIFYNY